MRGYIKDHRQELLSDIWSMPPLYHRLWQWLKYKANHDDAEIPMTDGTRLKISRGQHLTSIRKIAIGIGWYERGLWKEPNPKTISQMLKWMSDVGMIRVENGNRQYTLISIVNWDFYQIGDDESNAKVTVSKQSLDINKNDKNDKEINTPSRNKKKSYSEDDRFYQMALYFHQKIMEHAEINKKDHLVRNANMQKWADDFRKIVEIDKRDTQEMKRIIDWATSDPFWQLNILSPDKLRKQYTQLGLKMAAPVGGKQVTRDQRNKDLLQQKMREAEGLEQAGDNQVTIDYLNGLPDGRAD